MGPNRHGLYILVIRGYVTHCSEVKIHYVDREELFVRTNVQEIVLVSLYSTIKTTGGFTMDYVLPNEQRFAHIGINGELVETIIEAGTVAHVLEVFDSYTALTGDVMTRLELQIDGHELPLIHYAQNFNPDKKPLCQSCDSEFATIEDWSASLQCDECHKDHGHHYGGFRL
jgi:hypothetical protein